jgi:hypothetical protein
MDLLYLSYKYGLLKNEHFGSLQYNFIRNEFGFTTKSIEELSGLANAYQNTISMPTIDIKIKEQVKEDTKPCNTDTLTVKRKVKKL